MAQSWHGNSLWKKGVKLFLNNWNSIEEKVYIEGEAGKT